jgi:hypothetical protein
MPPRFAARAALCALVCAAANLAPRPQPALACGGFFCNQSTLQAIEQDREVVLFEVEQDGSVTVTVEIRYSGDPADFSWIIPIPAPQGLPGLPDSVELLDVPDQGLALLEALTRPRVLAPQIVWGDANAATGGGEDGGPPADPGDDAASGPRGGDDSEAPPPGPIALETLPVARVVDSSVVSSEDPGAVTDWLRENGYLVTPAMEPHIADYVASGSRFLALRLNSDAVARDVPPLGSVTPVRFRYVGDRISIPLRLTSVSTEPEMGFVVFVLADQRWISTNWNTQVIDEAWIQADPRTGDNNYYALVSSLAAANGGRTFFVEHAGDTGWMRNLNPASAQWGGLQEAAEFLDELGGRYAWLTRLYSRAGPVELALDPLLEESPGAPVPFTFDLSDRRVCWDFEHSPPAPCSHTACGPFGQCATTADGFQGCVCEAGFLARAITHDDLSSAGSLPSVTCQDSDRDLVADASSPLATEPCGGYDCGALGTCEALGGMPTCRCETGAVAVPTGPGSLLCLALDDVWEEDAVFWPGWPPDASDCPPAWDEGGDDDGAEDDDGDDDEPQWGKPGDGAQGGGSGGCFSAPARDPDPPLRRSYGCEPGSGSGSRSGCDCDSGCGEECAVAGGPEGARSGSAALALLLGFGMQMLRARRAPKRAGAR